MWQGWHGSCTYRWVRGQGRSHHIRTPIVDVHVAKRAHWIHGARVPNRRLQVRPRVEVAVVADGGVVGNIHVCAAVDDHRWQISCAPLILRPNNGGQWEQTFYVGESVPIRSLSWFIVHDQLCQAKHPAKRRQRLGIAHTAVKRSQMCTRIRTLKHTRAPTLTHVRSRMHAPVLTRVCTLARTHHTRSCRYAPAHGSLTALSRLQVWTHLVDDRLLCPRRHVNVSAALPLHLE